MSFRAALLAATILGVPAILGRTAQAQPVDGVYIGFGAGGNYLQQERVLASPGLDISSKKLRTNLGGVGVASVGYGFGNGLRLELEGNIRHNSVDNLTGNRYPGIAHGDQYSYGGMVNALFDMDIGYNWIYPYFGLGAGVENTRLDKFRYTAGIPGSAVPFRLGVNDDSLNFAYQGIFGLSFPLAAVPGLSLTTEYRFMGVLDAPSFKGYDNVYVTSPQFRGLRGNFNLNSDYNHSIIVGVKYAFNTAPPAVPAVPAAAPAQALARTYLVFFDWDKANLTDRARQIIGEAAMASTRVQTTRIDVQGNADRSGTPKYNQGLSLRRAEMVAAELVRRGVPRQEIAIQAFGDTRPLVPTAAGVREPQNRRVEIILH